MPRARRTTAPVVAPPVGLVPPPDAEAQLQTLRASIADVVSVTVPRITTLEEMREVEGRVNACRDLIGRAGRYFDHLLAPARETVTRLTSAKRALISPLETFDRAAGVQILDFRRREQAARQAAAREAIAAEAATLRTVATQALAQGHDAAAQEFLDTEAAIVAAPVHVERIDGEMTTSRRRDLEVTNVSAFCMWLANADPLVAADFAEVVTTAARRYHRDTGILPAGCTIAEREVLRRR